jgi:hypothetical protein
MLAVFGSNKSLEFSLLSLIPLSFMILICSIKSTRSLLVFLSDLILTSRSNSLPIALGRGGSSGQRRNENPQSNRAQLWKPSSLPSRFLNLNQNPRNAPFQVVLIPQIQDARMKCAALIVWRRYRTRARKDVGRQDTRRRANRDEALEAVAIASHSLLVVLHRSSQRFQFYSVSVSAPHQSRYGSVISK